MKAKIKVVKPKQTVSHAVVSNLRETIKGIRSGEITGVAVVAIFRDRECRNCYSAYSKIEMVGGVERLKHRIMKDIDAEHE